jgi:hypothetical protein
MRFLALLVFAVTIYLINYFLLQQFEMEMRGIILAIYIFMTSFSAFFEYSLMREVEAKRFITNYMAFSGGKLILSMFLLLIFAYLNRDYLRPFALSFLGIYFAFTAFEIIRLLRFLKK